MADQDPDQHPYTYSDAMNEWAAQQSFFRRVRAGVFHPAAASTGAGRILGYLWRVILSLVVLAIAVYYFLRSHIKGEAFADMIAAEAKAWLGAETSEFKPFKWKGPVASTPFFAMKGSPDSFFHELEGRHLRFKRSFLDLFGPEWNLDGLAIDYLAIQLRSGGLDGNPALAAPVQGTDPEGWTPGQPSLDMDLNVPAPTDDFEVNPLEDSPLKVDPLDDPLPAEGSPLESSPGGAMLGSPRPLVVRTAGFGIHPDLARLTFGRVEIAELNAFWGLTEYTRGALLKAKAVVAPGENGTWTVEALSGTINQNKWRDLKLAAPLVATYDGSQIVIKETPLTTKGGGSITLKGSVVTGSIPEFVIDLDLDRVPLDDLVSVKSPFINHLAASISGTAELRGSTNTSTGVVTTINGTLSQGTLRNLGLLDVLALVTSYDSLRRLPITGGTFSAVAQGDALEIRDFRLDSEDVVRVTGSLMIPSTGKPDVQGSIRVGLAARLLERFPKVRQRMFNLGQDGFWWLSVPVEGKVDNLAESLINETFKRYREEEEERRAADR